MKSEKLLGKVSRRKSIKVVEMCLEDIKEIKAIEIENNISSWSETEYLNELKRNDSISLVAKNPTEVVGFLIARLITTSNSETNFDGEVEIYNIAVRRKKHRKGIGQFLLGRCISIANLKFCGNIWLDVRKSNTSALHFYTKNGFEVIYHRKYFYHNPVEDAAIMCRKSF